MIETVFHRKSLNRRQQICLKQIGQVLEAIGVSNQRQAVFSAYLQSSIK